MKTMKITVLSSIALGLGLAAGSAQAQRDSTVDLPLTKPEDREGAPIVDKLDLNGPEEDKKVTRVRIYRTETKESPSELNADELLDKLSEATNPGLRSERRAAFRTVRKVYESHEAELQKIQKELADLNSATDRRRAELMKDLAAAKVREATTKTQKAQQEQRAASVKWAAQLGSQAYLADWLAQAHDVQRDEAPAWVIGVVIDDKTENGVVVNKVMEDKPAKKAGIQQGDVILECNSIELRDRGALVSIIQAAQDQPLTVKIRRRTHGEDGETVLSEKVMDLEITAEKNDRSDPKDAKLNAIDNFVLEQLSGNDAPAAGWPNAANQAQYYQLFQHPRQDAQHEQLRKDNAEVRELLEQLIEEVKKLQLK